ncbi:MAG: sigma-E factor regulatory protein RseB domain-containing protein [Armatimonadota bacterium]
MKLRTAAIIVLGGVALGLGVWRLAAHRRHAEAAKLLRAAYAEGRQVGFTGVGRIGARVGGQWTEGRARFAQAGGRRRIEGVGGPGLRLALLDDGETMWRLHPALRRAVGIGPSEGQHEWDHLLRNYRLRPEGEAVVAGRQAGRIALVSRRERRPALRLWIDRETKVPLRTDSFDTDGHLVARTALNHVDYAAAAPQEELRVPEGWRHGWLGDGQPQRLTIEEFAAKADFTPRRPSYVPGGYVHRGLYGHTCPRGRQYAEIRYGDGLRTLSVFEHRPLGLRRGGGGRAWGPGRGMGRGRGRGWRVDPEPVVIAAGATKSIRQRREDLMIVITGDLPARELLEVLRSVPSK